MANQRPSERETDPEIYPHAEVADKEHDHEDELTDEDLDERDEADNDPLLG